MEPKTILWIVGVAYTALTVVFMIKGIIFFGRSTDPIREHYHKAMICQKLKDDAGARFHFVTLLYYSKMMSLSPDQDSLRLKAQIEIDKMDVNSKTTT